MRLSYFPCQRVKSTKVEDWEIHLLRGGFLIDILFEPLNDSEYSLTNPLKRFSHKLHLSLRTTQNGKEWTYLGPWIFVSKQGLYVVNWIQKLTLLGSENLRAGSLISGLYPVDSENSFSDCWGLIPLILRETAWLKSTYSLEIFLY